jgi:outer membrane lipoprotein-sorting protein
MKALLFCIVLLIFLGTCSIEDRLDKVIKELKELNKHFSKLKE